MTLTYLSYIVLGKERQIIVYIQNLKIETKYFKTLKLKWNKEIFLVQLNLNFPILKKLGINVLTTKLYSCWYK